MAMFFSKSIDVNACTRCVAHQELGSPQKKSTTEFDRRLFRQETTASSADRFSKFFFAMEAAKLFTSRRVAMLQFSRCSVPLGHLSGSKIFYRMVQENS